MVASEGIAKLAALARIGLSAEEKERMPQEFISILDYVAAVSKIAAGKKEQSRSLLVQVNVIREDDTPEESGIYTDSLLSLAPEREGNYIKVKKIL